MKLPEKYGDFSNLEALFDILNGKDALIIAEGIYGADQPRPGPHITVTSADSEVMYDFIKQKDGNYIMTVKKN